jgi:hypothetical protein
LIQSAALTAGLAVFLAGCANTGDFGRYQPSYFEDQFLPGVKSVFSGFGSGAVSSYPLTGDEQRLRELAQNLAQPHARATPWGNIRRQAHAVGLVRDTTQANRARGHAIGLVPLKYKSPYWMHDALNNAIKDDIGQVREFMTVVARVYDTDNIRYRRLVNSSNLSGLAIRNVSARIRENRGIVGATLVVLDNRVADYRLDFEHMRLRAPSAREGRILANIENFDADVAALKRRLGRWAQRSAAAAPERPGPYYDF